VGKLTASRHVITGTPTHNVGGRLVMLTSVCRRRVSSSSVVVCNTPRQPAGRLTRAGQAMARRWRYAASRLHGNTARRANSVT